MLTNGFFLMKIALRPGKINVILERKRQRQADTWMSLSMEKKEEEQI